MEDHTLKSLHRPVRAEFLFGGALHIVENWPGRSTFGQPPEVRHRKNPLPARRSFRHECGPGKTCDFRDTGKLALNPAPPTLCNTRAALVTAGLGLAWLLHRLTLPEPSRRQPVFLRQRRPVTGSRGKSLRKTGPETTRVDGEAVGAAEPAASTDDCAGGSSDHIELVEAEAVGYPQGTLRIESEHRNERCK